MSSAWSATIFFSRAFSFSGWRSRLASETSMPPFLTATCKRWLGNTVLTAQVHHAHAGFGLPQYPNDLLFAESAPFHSCAPMPGTLTFQWTSFLGRGHCIRCRRSFFFVVEFPLQQFFQNGSGFLIHDYTSLRSVRNIFAQAFFQRRCSV